jgi:hypothetical protein
LPHALNPVKPAPVSPGAGPGETDVTALLLTGR